ncbi:hypothetical protein [Kordiimonas sp.]|uniref:hypothetical protein n=1 Tax=Kordiimonas sp. TaxID=1970157 RepID=UPI003A95DDF1
MTLSRDQVFVFLGFIAGSNIGTAVVLTFLPEGVYAYGGYFITASATLTAAVVAALMVRHQLEVNYRNQRRLEIIRYISDTQKQERLTKLHKALGSLQASLPSAYHFRGVRGRPAEPFDFELFRARLATVEKCLPVLAPVSSLYFSALKIKLGYLEEDVGRAFDCIEDEAYIDVYSRHFTEIREEIYSLIIGKTNSLIFNSEWVKMDSKDWKAHFQTRLGFM